MKAWKRVLLIVFGVFLLAIPLVLRFGFQVIRVYGQSMEPALHEGDRLVIGKGTYHHGDILVFGSREGTLVKRVIGCPGDTVRMHDGVLTVNGIYTEEPYLAKTDTSEFTVTVPDGQYFVLGDNREHSKDSRAFGCVPESMIVGRVLWIFPK